MQVARGLSRLRWRTGVLRFGLVGLATIVVMLVAASCGGTDPEDGVATALLFRRRRGKLRHQPVCRFRKRLNCPSERPWYSNPWMVSQWSKDRSSNSKLAKSGPADLTVVMATEDESDEGGAIFGADGAFAAPPMAVTAKLCSEPEGVMDQADAFMAALMAGDRYRVVEERLEIADGDGTVRLVFAKQVPLDGTAAELSGTSWRQVTEAGDALPATMTFLDDRLVVGDTACRPYLATYSATEDGVRFPSKSMLQRGSSCSDEKRMLEGEFGDFFTWAREYAVREQGGSSRLTMRSSEGETLYFDPLPVSYEDVANAEWVLVTFVEVSPDEFGMWRTRRDWRSREPT